MVVAETETTVKMLMSEALVATLAVEMTVTALKHLGFIIGKLQQDRNSRSERGKKQKGTQVELTTTVVNSSSGSDKGNLNNSGKY